ncbi:hypothetical protein CBR_g22838 [Chara braunii]|uniref:Helitron helicase-like domain-containing protein n=1 Tax=Chara braunii TaxID=69332 RepID=A0A388L306_CHABU|nr:hypothetical protein CBR_g22838 [Chara braunii]|eukprot:GBG76622.1 hypothetical protein CBR_g22838 [Chara braunii]
MRRLRTPWRYLRMLALLNHLALEVEIHVSIVVLNCDIMKENGQRCVVEKVQSVVLYENGLAKAPRSMKFFPFWTSQSFDGRFFRNNARIINNSLSLASSRLKQPSDGVQGFWGEVRAQGPIFHHIGALAVGEDERPQFAQLYLHDPQRLDDAIDQRVDFLNLPARTPDAQLDQAKRILRRFHELLQRCNNYVKDFLTFAVLPPEALNGGKLVINADVMPDGEHARRYNRPMGLHEICVLMANELLSRELEIRLRAPPPGERQTVVVSECSRAPDCLRFPNIRRVFLTIFGRPP